MRPIAAALLVTMLAATGAAARDTSPRTITVTGQGEVLAAPDYGTIDVGVTTSATTVAAALQQNNAEMTRMVASVKKAGVAETDMQTTQFSVAPQHPRTERGGEDYSKVIGYSVSNRVTVTVRKIPLLAQVIDAASQAGANSVGSVVFQVKDRDALKDQARTQAMRDARRQAQILAAAEGLTVGKAITISTAMREFGFAGQIAPPAPAPVPQGTPILPGQITVSASATVEYELQ